MSSARRTLTPQPTARLPGGEPLTNADIASQLLSVAQLLSAKRENPYKIKAYRRAAESIKTLGESIADLVRRDVDLTQFSGIGAGLSSAIREIVHHGQLAKLQTLRSEVSPELAALGEYPRLDPKRVVQIYKKLKIGSVPELKTALTSGAIGAKLGPRLEQHVRQALTESTEMLLLDADELVSSIETFLRKRCGVNRAEHVGDARRRVEIIRELSFLVETADFPDVVAKFQTFGGGTKLLGATESAASFQVPSGVAVSLESATADRWGLAQILATGSAAHLDKLDTSGRRLGALARSRTAMRSETEVYRKLGMDFIPPELREGNDEVERAAQGTLPRLVTVDEISGELHAHSTSSDGAHSIEQMAAGAQERGYDYLGISDHSQSLKIAGGVTVADLRKQLRTIDKLNRRLDGIRILKSAEVDILVDGTLDYPDDVLRELDYTICSIHSKFALGREQQTTRILRAMENPRFNILGHATGRLLLRRTGYDIDIERVIAQAKAHGCFFEINASPDRLDLSADHARLAQRAGVKIAICTDAHSIGELAYIRCGVDQARRAGLSAEDILNTRPWPELLKLFHRP